MSGPHAIACAVCSGVAFAVACAKLNGVGSSELTFQPSPDQRNCSCATRTASSSVGAQHTGTWPILRDPGPCSPSHSSTSSRDGSVATMWSTIEPHRSIPASPDTATPISTAAGSHTRAESTRKYSPSHVTSSPVSSSWMTVIASSSISWRTCTLGQPSPTTCSLRFSPEPRLSWKRPSLSSCSIAACWATTAGWYRIVGQVTWVMSWIRSVACATAPSVTHAFGECPCSVSHGE